MNVLAINHRVENYETWKSVFDSYPPATHGALFHRVNRAVDDPNNITVVAGFGTTEAARGFVEDPELAEKMHDAGVIGAPRIEIYEEVESTQA